jgi:uncharacterized repeat protein (TIGR01451 family)
MCRIWIVVWVLLVIALFGLPAGVQAEGADDGLVAEWHFDEGSGSVLVDSSGNGNDGVIHGATWVERKYGGALSFDGRNDYIKVPYSESLYIHGSFAIELWVYIEGNQGTYRELIGNRGSGTRGEYSWVMMISPDNEFEYWVGDPHSTYTLIKGKKLTTNAWYHVVFIRDAGVGKIYLNGKLDNSMPSIDVGHLTSDIAIGYDIQIDKYPFNGIIDEIRIYNRVLTAEEIKQHYEGNQTALSLTKSAAPHPIKQGQTTMVTLTVKNTGTTEITDIEVADTIPSDLTFISGETSKTYTFLKPKDSREFQYTLQLNDAGTFNLDPATATYSDEEGNYHTAESKTATITVIANTPQTAPKSSAEISTASVHLHGEKTDVVLGEDVLLKLSAVNIIGNPLMHVQVIIIPPSGWSVTSSEFAKSGAGQYTTTYDIEEGVGRDIEVRIVPNQIGDDFHVQGRIIYYFGDDSDAREDHTLTLPITVRAEAENGQGAERTSDTSGSEEDGSSTPGFAAVFAVAGVLAVYLRRR